MNYRQLKDEIQARHSEQRCTEMNSRKGVQLSPISTTLLLSSSHEEPRFLGSFVRPGSGEFALVRRCRGQFRGQLVNAL